MSSDSRALLGISMGDPAGIGPEVSLQAMAMPEAYQICRPLVVGDLKVLRTVRNILGLDLEFHSVKAPNQGKYRHGTVDVLDLDNLAPADHKFQQATAPQGAAAFEYVTTVIELALAGALDGTVTGPINKAAINAAGHHFAGHTENLRPIDPDPRLRDDAGGEEFPSSACIHPCLPARGLRPGETGQGAEGDSAHQ